MASDDGRISVALPPAASAAAAATQLDIAVILREAQQRWLRPAEICGILQNHRMFHIAPEPPTRPPSGSLFLFDKKVVRFFRKDGHNWRKKRDGKTVKEAHEKLKSGSVDVLHCYYAHGEENENFQRRTYWMLEEPFTNIALVHYLEVKGGKQNFNRLREAEEITQQFGIDSPLYSNSSTSLNHGIPQMEAESLSSGPVSLYDDPDTDKCRTSPRYNAYPGIHQQHEDGSVMDTCLNRSILMSSANSLNVYRGAASVPDERGLGLDFSGFRTQHDITDVDNIFYGCPADFPSESFHSSITSAENHIMEDLSSFEAIASEDLYTSISFDELDCDEMPAPELQAAHCSTSAVRSSSLSKQSSLDLFKIESDGMKKYDSFSRWMSKEFDVADLPLTASSDVFWDSVETQGAVESTSESNPKQLDAYVVSPSLSQEQLFSILDILPTWAYEGLKTKVIISGTFLKSLEDVESRTWSCMFGNHEVPAEVLSNGKLRCYAPAQKPGIVPFYITCSDRLACSEIREFEYREIDGPYMETADTWAFSINETHLLLRLEKLLSLGSTHQIKHAQLAHEEKYASSNAAGTSIVDGISSDHQSGTAAQEIFHHGWAHPVQENTLKEKLDAWLLQMAKDPSGITILCKEGQGVIHIMAALGYDWAMQALVCAGLNVNFRDANGWTALHWAAFCGKESTVVALVKMGAAPGVLTDPTPDFPSGRTPADLASFSGHKGISGFLAEFSLTSHLSTLSIRDSKNENASSCSRLNLGILARASSIKGSQDDFESASMKDSLSAICNATQAAAKIHQVFRVDSFQRKKKIELGDANCGLSEEHTLSRLSVMSSKPALNDVPLHAAAIRIQNKFRGWKGRKEFIHIRQKIVKIQAHVRGYQARKHYRKIVWSVGIVEKIIIWRRKSKGLKGFRVDGLLEGPTVQAQPGQLEEDVLRQGRKKVEANVERALARVQSMARYPEGRDQYRRLLNGITQIQEFKATQNSPGPS